MSIVAHPLDPLTADELRRTADIVRKERGDVSYIFNSMTLKEPAKDVVMGYFNYDSSLPKVTEIEREALVVLIDRPSGLVHDITVSLTKDKITEWIKTEGQQPTVNALEMIEAEQAMKKDPKVIEECRKLGIMNMDQVFIDPWGIGWSNIKGKRLVQAICYLRTSPDDNQYAHPLDFNPLYDVNEQKVLDIIVAKRRNSKFERPTIPMANHHFLPEHLGEENLRKDLKPIQIIQPEGVSFTIRGKEIAWQKWNMHIGFNHREGLVLSNLTYKDMDGSVRPLFYRLSLAEMVVPYANPYEPYNHKMAFDVGEYGMGFLSNSLELGCDCVGSIYYMDAILNDLKGDPWVIPKAICIHEEDSGLLFKHTDYRSGKAHSARSRRLVISHIVTAGNYDYGLYYYFYQDGTIQFDVKATGELNTQVLAEDEAAAPYGTIVAPQIDAQHHQHLFSFRVDPMVDGIKNSVAETDVVPSEHPVGHPDNMVGNGFKAVTKVFNDTDEAQGVASLEKHRSWKIINENRIHPYAKQPVGWKIHNPSPPTLLAKPGSIVHERAIFATKNLWVTKYHRDQKFPAGYHIYQSDPKLNLGIPQYIKEKKSVRNESIVVWITFGLTHIPRVEDFPIMPVDIVGVQLKPTNFFMGNPGIDIPLSNKVSTKSAYASANVNSCCGKTNL
ncbi:copper amine oxidase [Phascolomyces articulosus]|uniref:Amine oxidase n=1 Tax=Phascolomyces articulosus TaxID=60185 RepID=A0AAD5K7W1_9FUNG|nr:copper amine oxidase [Phascolomyces articulosus]